MALQAPTVVGLTICSNIAREQHSGNYSVIRSFTGMPIPAFPGVGEPFCVFAVLTDGEGDVPFQLAISRCAERFERVHVTSGTLHFSDRLQLVELVLRFSRFVFPAPDTYLFALFIDDELVAHRSLRIYQRGELP